MNQTFQTIENYELFLYSLKELYSSISASSVVLIRRGSTLAKVEGEIIIDQGYRIVIRERLLYDTQPILMDSYGYEIWKDNKKIFWYDSQPHPNDEKLQSTHPHHKHIQPDIKQNRIPAPNMSFNRPNIPVIIEEIENLLR